MLVKYILRCLTNVRNLISRLDLENCLGSAASPTCKLSICSGLDNLPLFWSNWNNETGIERRHFSSVIAKLSLQLLELFLYIKPNLNTSSQKRKKRLTFWICSKPSEGWKVYQGSSLMYFYIFWQLLSHTVCPEVIFFIQAISELTLV